jgi:hypothetical protein
MFNHRAILGAFDLAKLLKLKDMVQAGESNCDRSLKTRKLLILKDAKNDRICKNPDNWNVSGTRH